MQYLAVRSVIAIILSLSVNFIVEAVAGNISDECVLYSNCSEGGDTLEYHICQARHSCSNFVNISTNLTLSSVLSLSNLYNITVSGHNSPTVNCTNGTGGGLHLHSCHNCTIKGINWVGCGNNSITGLQFNDSSNVAIKNCTFQQSVGRAVMLLEVSGDIEISHCKFVNNSKYKGHGSALYYSSASDTAYYKLIINNCSFTHNKGEYSPC